MAVPAKDTSVLDYARPETAADVRFEQLCWNCDYALVGLPAGHPCPECGTVQSARAVVIVSKRASPIELDGFIILFMVIWGIDLVKDVLSGRAFTEHGFLMFLTTLAFSLIGVGLAVAWHLRPAPRVRLTPWGFEYRGRAEKIRERWAFASVIRIGRTARGADRLLVLIESHPHKVPIFLKFSEAVAVDLVARIRELVRDDPGKYVPRVIVEPRMQYQMGLWGGVKPALFAGRRLREAESKPGQATDAAGVGVSASLLRTAQDALPAADVRPRSSTDDASGGSDILPLLPSLETPGTAKPPTR